MGEENPGSNSHEPLASASVRWMGEAGIAASSRAEPGTGADALQRPLVPRFRCRARLTAGVRRQLKEGETMSIPAKTPWRLVGEHRASYPCAWDCAQRPGDGGVYKHPGL